MDDQDLIRKNRRMGLYVILAVVFMVGLSFASVPLYNLFCQVTGYGGTTQTAEALPSKVIEDRTITIRFNTDVAPDLPWEFEAEKKTVSVHPGQKGLITYRAKSLSDLPVAGAALYNVIPLKAGQYFHKVQCFCFEEQILEPGQEVSMPVMFYVDPSIADDPGMSDVNHITLSYTFYKTETEALEQALEDFYNQAPETSETKNPGEI